MTGVCIPVEVPDKYSFECATRAHKCNPVNHPGVTEPQRIAVLTTKYWGPAQRELTVTFMERVQPSLRDAIIDVANSWDCGITFRYSEKRDSVVRISLADSGYWSYLGTDLLSIPRNRHTMSLSRMHVDHPRFVEVTSHEVGHSLGMPHEHMRGDIQNRLDREKTYAYFRQTSGWNRSTVDSQIFAPMSEGSLEATETDDESIMCYQFPGSITKDGNPIVGGQVINERDHEFAREIYPLEVPDPVEPVEPIEPLPDGNEWENVVSTEWDWVD